jgi:uncharacterized protein YdhG (YjbR/CyaY superfamily)
MKKYKTIEEFLNDLTTEKRHQVESLRDLIIKTEPLLVEHIKWNAPSYVLNGEDRITFNIMNKQDVVKIIIHMGVTNKEDKKKEPIMHDESGLIEWSSDIRGVITFNTLEEVTTRLNSLKIIIDNWLRL